MCETLKTTQNKTNLSSFLKKEMQHQIIRALTEDGLCPNLGLHHQLFAGWLAKCFISLQTQLPLQQKRFSPVSAAVKVKEENLCRALSMGQEKAPALLAAESWPPEHLAPPCPQVLQMARTVTRVPRLSKPPCSTAHLISAIEAKNSCLQGDRLTHIPLNLLSPSSTPTPTLERTPNLCGVLNSLHKPGQLGHTLPLSKAL